MKKNEEAISEYKEKLIEFKSFAQKNGISIDFAKTIIILCSSPEANQKYGSSVKAIDMAKELYLKCKEEQIFIDKLCENLGVL